MKFSWLSRFTPQVLVFGMSWSGRRLMGVRGDQRYFFDSSASNLHRNFALFSTLLVKMGSLVYWSAHYLQMIGWINNLQCWWGTQKAVYTELFGKLGELLFYCNPILKWDGVDGFGQVQPCFISHLHFNSNHQIHNFNALIIIIIIIVLFHKFLIWSIFQFHPPPPQSLQKKLPQQCGRTGGQRHVIANVGHRHGPATTGWGVQCWFWAFLLLIPAG